MGGRRVQRLDGAGSARSPRSALVDVVARVPRHRAGASRSVPARRAERPGPPAFGPGRPDLRRGFPWLPLVPEPHIHCRVLGGELLQPQQVDQVLVAVAGEAARRAQARRAAQAEA